jgi:hypothetical protein
VPRKGTSTGFEKRRIIRPPMLAEGVDRRAGPHGGQHVDHPLTRECVAGGIHGGNERGDLAAPEVDNQ